MFSCSRRGGLPVRGEQCPQRKAGPEDVRAQRPPLDAGHPGAGIIMSWELLPDGTGVGRRRRQRGASWVACQARAWEQEGRGLFPEGDAGWRHQAMRVDQSATRAERPGLRPPSPICLPPLPPPALTTCPPGLPCSLLSSQGSWDLVTGPSASPRTLPTHTHPTLSTFLPPLKGPPAPGPQLSGNSEFQAYGVTWGICSQADMIQIRPPSELVTLGKLPDHSELQVPHR